jgi:hypothetical protein
LLNYYEGVLKKAVELDYIDETSNIFINVSKEINKCKSASNTGYKKITQNCMIRIAVASNGKIAVYTAENAIKKMQHKPNVLKKKICDFNIYDNRERNNSILPEQINKLN